MQILDRSVETIRRRPGLFVGNTGALGLSHLASFVLDAFAEETPRPEGIVEVQLEGHRLTVASAVAPSCAKALLDAVTKGVISEDASDGAWEGLVVAALSSRFSVTFDTQKWEGRQGRGQLETTDHRAPWLLFFEPDPQIFGAEHHPDAHGLLKRARELALTVPGLHVKLKHVESGLRWAGCFPEGMKTAVAELASPGLGLPVWRMQTQWNGVAIDAALGFGKHAMPWLSFANTVPTVKGGSHLKALEQALTLAGGELVRPGACGAISIRAPRGTLRFQGPTKDALATEGLTEGVSRALLPSLQAHLAQHRDS